MDFLLQEAGRKDQKEQTALRVLLDWRIIAAVWSFQWCKTETEGLQQVWDLEWSHLKATNSRYQGIKKSCFPCFLFHTSSTVSSLSSTLCLLTLLLLLSLAPHHPPRLLLLHSHTGTVTALIFPKLQLVKTSTNEQQKQAFHNRDHIS